MTLFFFTLPNRVSAKIVTYIKTYVTVIHFRQIRTKGSMDPVKIYLCKTDNIKILKLKSMDMKTAREKKIEIPQIS